MILEDSVEIRTTPKRIFDFFEHMDENYQSWHPDHVLFRWVDGLGRSRSELSHPALSTFLPSRKRVLGIPHSTSSIESP